MTSWRVFQPRQNGQSSDPFVIRTGSVRGGQMDTVYRTDWAAGVYIGDRGQHETVGGNFNLRLLPLLSAAAVLAMFLLLGRTAWLQIVKGEEYYALAEGNRIRIERIEPKRGIIYDRTGRALVMNQADFLLYAVPADLPKEQTAREAIFGSIAAILPGFDAVGTASTVGAINPRSLERFRPIAIAEHVPYEPAMRLYLASAQWPGLVVTTRTRREYLAMNLTAALGPATAGGSTSTPAVGTSLAHVLGYTGKINREELERSGDEYLPIDQIGKMGVEYFWENELKGLSGSKYVEVDALGKEKQLISETPSVNGKNLVLSIDVALQAALETFLRRELDARKLGRASAVLIDPANGELLALVSLPAYDNNLFARGISTADYAALVEHPDNPLFNRSVSGEFPSGSTIKPVMAAAALQEGVIAENTTVLSTGGIRVGQWFFPDWRAGGHGRVNVYDAIAQSVNTFFYYIGGGYEDFRGLGVDRIVQYEALFGLGTQTGVDLAGEASGFLPTPEWKEETKGERWYIGDTYHLSIGQGDLLVTPLQVAAYTAVFANSGKLFRPHLVHAFLPGGDQPAVAITADPIRQDFLDPAVIRIVREGMRRTVTGGSARSLQSVPVPVAGKTGTAQWSTKKDTHAWFTGFAPFDDPELALTILIEEGGEGSEAAVPVARDFLTWYFTEYKKEPERN